MRSRGEGRGGMLMRPGGGGGIHETGGRSLQIILLGSSLGLKFAGNNFN